MRAAMNGHTGVVKRLLAAGADRNLKDAQGKTAAMWAEKNGHMDIATMLRSNA
jgi:ankyrin repeat protein